MKRIVQGIGILILIGIAVWFVMGVMENPHVKGSGIPPEAPKSRVMN